MDNFHHIDHIEYCKKQSLEFSSRSSLVLLLWWPTACACCFSISLVYSSAVSIERSAFNRPSRLRFCSMALRLRQTDEVPWIICRFISKSEFANSHCVPAVEDGCRTRWYSHQTFAIPDERCIRDDQHTSKAQSSRQKLRQQFCIHHSYRSVPARWEFRKHSRFPLQHNIAFFLDAWVMPITVNLLFKRLTYFSKRVGAVSFSWSSNSGKVGRLIAVAIVQVGVPEDCESAEVDGEFDSSKEIKTHSISDVCLFNSAPQIQRFPSAIIAITSSSPLVRFSF